MKHSDEFMALVDEARKNVRELSVAEARERVHAGAQLIDVREESEWNAGHAAEAIHLGRGVLERDIVQKVPDKAKELVLYCGGGYRSILAVESLQKMGYRNVFSVIGGWKAWTSS